MVKSLYDVFAKATDVGYFFLLIWYNPWVLFIWFHLWWSKQKLNKIKYLLADFSFHFFTLFPINMVFHLKTLSRFLANYLLNYFFYILIYIVDLLGQGPRFIKLTLPAYDFLFVWSLRNFANIDYHKTFLTGLFALEDDSFFKNFLNVLKILWWWHCRLIL